MKYPGSVLIMTIESGFADEYRSLNATLSSVLVRVAEDDWNNDSPCTGWKAVDVLRHLISTQRTFLEERGIPLNDELRVVNNPVAAWSQHSAWVQDLLQDPKVSDKEYEGYFGTAKVGESMVRFYGFDMVVHRWDIARAAGLDDDFSSDEMNMLEGAIAEFGESLYSKGVCKPALEVPNTTDRQTLILAKLGRHTDVTR